MAQTLDNQLISIALQNTINNPQALQSPVSATMNLPQSYGWTTGNGGGNADRVYGTTITIAASGNQQLALTGSLVDAVGTTFTIARVKALYVAASAANVNSIVVGNAATNGWVSWVNGATAAVNVLPGGALLLVAPQSVAYPVTAGTADKLLFTNGGAGSSVTFNLVIVGSSA